MKSKALALGSVLVLSVACGENPTQDGDPPPVDTSMYPVQSISAAGKQTCALMRDGSEVVSSFCVKSHG